MLASEWLEQVLTWLDLRQVFICMRVNREWSRAARRTVHQWDKLKLSRGYVLEHRHCITLIMPTKSSHLISLMIRSLSQMCSLRHFISYSFDMDPGFSQVIKGNAATLQTITFPFLPFNEGMRYPHLKTLKVQHEPDSAALVQCPRLQRLEVDNAVSLNMLHHLPQQIMQSIVISIQVPESMSAFLRLFNTLHKMSNIQSVTISYVDTGKPVANPPGFIAPVNAADGQSEGDDDMIAGGATSAVDGDVVFDDVFHSLISLRIYCRFTGSEFMKIDETMDAHVVWCPNLQILSLFEMSMTDACLVSIAKFKHLRDLELSPATTNFTTTGIMSLLKGESRRSFMSIYISGCRELDEDAVTAEVKQIALETDSVIRTVKCPRYADDLFAFIMRFFGCDE